MSQKYLRVLIVFVTVSAFWLLILYILPTRLFQGAFLWAIIAAYFLTLIPMCLLQLKTRRRRNPPKVPYSLRTAKPRPTPEQLEDLSASDAESSLLTPLSDSPASSQPTKLADIPPAEPPRSATTLQSHSQETHLQPIGLEAEPDDQMPETSSFGVEQAQILIEQGLKKISETDYWAALSKFTQAIRFNPNSAVAYYQRSICYLRMGYLEESLNDCCQALLKDPTFTEAFNHRGNIRYEKGDLQGASNDYRQAWRLDPNFKPAIDNLKRVQQRLKGNP